MQATFQSIPSTFLLPSTHSLAAFICGYATVSIVISGNYGLSAFKEDLQKMYRRAGLKGEGLLFLLTDSQIVDERMLVSVNDLLASGEITDLFAPEDRDEIANAMRGETKAAGLVDTTENCWATFLGKVSKPQDGFKSFPCFWACEIELALFAFRPSNLILSAKLCNPMCRSRPTCMSHSRHHPLARPSVCAASGSLRQSTRRSSTGA